MKIAIISDLHLYHWDRANSNNHPVDTVKRSLDEEKPDLILDAGDYEKETDWGVATLRIPGNHDYYGKVWNHNYDPYVSYEANFIGDVSIGMATFWGDYNKYDPVAMEVYRQCLVDCRAIIGFSPQKAYETHIIHKEFLRKENELKQFDIVVTHNTPSFQSVHERYKDPGPNFLINYGFSSDLDDFVREINPKYWVHGHSHDCFNYFIGNTNVLSNPCGYPSERISKPPYVPVYIEL